MNPRDRELGMDRAISRRDFLGGVGALTAGVLLPGCAQPELPGIGYSADAASYPPLRTGLRGSQPGSYEVAHGLALEGRRDFGPVTEEPPVYDLVVVGSGLSGLAAAYYYRDADPSARVLILDNHDDFGGHARRNEFQIGDRTVVGYGGSQTLESPQRYSGNSKRLLASLGVDLPRLADAYDLGFFKRHGLGGGIYFDRASYGVDRVVRFEPLYYSGYLPLAPTRLSAEEAVAQMPVSPEARVELLRLFTTRENRIPEIPAAQQPDYLATISYEQFLAERLDVRHPEVLALLQGILTDISNTIDVATADGVLIYAGLPGLDATAIRRETFEEDPYVLHFPDGNATLARLLVRALIPGVAEGDSMEDVVAAHFDYGRLDREGSPVRLRLESTAIRVEHEGAPESSNAVAVTYVRRGRARRVRARSCVLAGYNAMVPYLCPELPQSQREALALSVKVPIIYSTVLLRNWRAWKELGIAAVAAPGSYHANAMLDFPVSIGGYQFSGGPDEPIMVHMERFGKEARKPGMHPRQQNRAQRYHMLATQFPEIERSIRTQLAGMLSSGGFDPAQDIQAITVNRWAHGYAYGYNTLLDSEEDYVLHEVGRQRFGRIAIANSDAGARSTLDTAFDQARRAVDELTERQPNARR